MTDIEFFDLQVSEISHPCQSDFTIKVPYNPDFEYQWYLSGIALDGETSSKLSQHYGEGYYQVRIIDGSACRLSTAYEYRVPKFNTPTQRSICKGDYFEFGPIELSEPGSYIDTFLSENGCDSIVTLNLDVIGERYDTLEASILEGEIYEIGDYRLREEGDHPLTFTSSLGCDSLVLLQLTNFNIYIPNVFSPNNDGINDVFQPFDSVNGVRSIDMKIYDRWGNLIHQSSQWDGSEHQPSVYVYAMNIEFEHRESKLYYGSVTLLR